MRRFPVILPLVLIIAGQNHAQRTLPLPDSLTGIIRSTEKIGKAIYDNNFFSAAATDILFEKEIVAQSRNIRGWITLETPAQWVVKFYGIEGKKYASLYEVIYTKKNQKYPRLLSYAKSPPLPPSEQAMCKALALAALQKFMQCEDHYNTLIFPGSLFNRSGWVVYLLAATRRRDDVVVGGHYRMDISADGDSLLAKHQLSEACQTIPSIKKSHLDKDVANEDLLITHTLTDYPTEIHVFLSLFHHYPLLVVTKHYRWKVQEGKIGLLSIEK